MTWSIVFCGLFFLIMKHIGRLRVSHVYEVIGIDLLMHQSIEELRQHPIVVQANFKRNQKPRSSDQEVHKNLTDLLEIKKQTNMRHVELE